MNFEVICFKICILKICDIYLNSKYFFNQNISQDSKNSGEFLWYIIFEKSFSNLVKLQKNDRNYQNCQWDCELRANNAILLAKPGLENHGCHGMILPWSYHDHGETWSWSCHDNGMAAMFFSMAAMIHGIS